MIDHIVFWLSIIGAGVAVTLFLAGCEPRVEVPADCAPARWSEVMRGCVETGEGDGAKGRLVIPECCGRAP